MCVSNEIWIFQGEQVVCNIRLTTKLSANLFYFGDPEVISSIYSLNLDRGFVYRFAAL